MRNLNQYAQECMTELDNIGIEYGNIINWKVNTRAHRRWGQCKAVTGGYEININKDLLDERNDVQGLKNTIIHELLHSVKGCMNHGENWKNQAEIVKYELGYDITRCSSAEDKGVVFHTQPTARRASGNEYILKCNCCGCEIHRERMSKAVQHPEWYRCGKCGGRLTRIK